MTARTGDTDTIAAIATPPGRGGVGMVRVSGSLVPTIASEVLGDLPEPRRAALRVFRDAEGEMLDGGLALYFPAPNSFTGEDVLELHGHGGPVVMDMLLARVLELGARVAQPGEFTQRAFLNDKLDLTQAEAIADLIDSGSSQAARAALRSLQGEFSVAVHSLTEAVTETRMHVEAAIDFPEEEVDFLADSALHERIASAIELCEQITAKAQQGALLREGMTVVIAGRPNAGKSSLLNRLAGYEAAIVTDIPGTTRDVLRERIHIDGMPLHVADTAGLRDDADIVEAEGIRRARTEMTRADRILYVIDATRSLDDEGMQAELTGLPADIPVSVVLNKIDIAQGRSRYEQSQPPRLHVSATTGEGMDLLREHLKECMGYQGAGTGTISARRRHLDALNRASAHLYESQRQLTEKRAGELMAEELRQAQHCLSEITGEFTPDDLLGRIFTSFCIGK
ncbi:tRNA uridine-5-carboxymethylaminomethyl(34) synthesis GTPase MnmE [Steroidobacter sp. S1-65]|uniref:tRNA modification GTPase MnmE n=1 Tax=Steroidobacter gossypii TaxID=2805490 RepID=A0ABS1WT39_9GAMM|nr:tRNA uridine-5-carboxymethylaminomethyl(34) synthesis GTPase MnmE [Steroidobacter gossypii]MBM0104108.1 tRNA uridine-5-carboxymethylaminomethyl(34) synthesis GTPase MnmE [Steroidobacter gossypii]